MNRKATLWVLGVFLLGIALGGVLTHIADQRVMSAAPHQTKEDWRKRVVNEMTHELNLSGDQQQQVTAILEDTKKKYDSVFETTRPQMEQARQEGRARMRSVLTPEQLPKFDEYLKRLDERRRQNANR
jgi:Spy/CpxP family protein refolding chaperone